MWSKVPQIFPHKQIKRHLDEVDGEVDGLLPHANVVGNDIRHKVVFGPPRIGLLLLNIRDTELKTRFLFLLLAPGDVSLPFQGSCSLNF